MEELCIGGGGIKGIAFLGALYELDVNGLIQNIKKYSGTSVGGLLCILLIIGYTPKELIDIVFKLNFEDIKDIDIGCMFGRMSVMKGEKFKEHIKKIISGKENFEMTLFELYKKYNKELIITVVCVDTGKIEYISSQTNPDITIYKLACMTTCVPLLFPPEIYNDKRYADGGIIDNTPVRVLCNGSWCITSSTICYHGDKNMYDYFTRIMDIIYIHLQDIKIGDYPNVIKIQLEDTPGVGIDDKLSLVNKGRLAVREKLSDIHISINSDKKI